MNTYTIMSLRRSGCHAMAQWIGSLMGVCLYANDNRSNVGDVVLNGTLQPIADALRPSIPAGTSVIYGKEDKPLDKFCAELPNTQVILNLRDPFNTFASLRKLHQRPLAASFVQLWLSYAQEALGLTKIIHGGAIFTNYNKWLTDEGYRRDLASRLGHNFTDAGFFAVPQYGNGSSFTHRKPIATEDDRTQRLHRYEIYKDDESFLESIAHPIVWDYATQLFPEATEAAARVLPRP